ncbi:MAG: mechanosensitive ion channel [Spirulinaceae cyanobacterium SM2_1_0]|nr:mechanosensitive ion channel [Spirulinaceae cyanobacterium SM2_1_0]
MNVATAVESAASPAPKSAVADKAKAAANAAIDKLDQIATSSKILTYSLLAIAVIIGIIGIFFASKRFQQRFQERLSPQFKVLYRVVFAPYQGWLAIALTLVILDTALLNLRFLPDWGSYVELVIGLGTAMLIAWLGSRLFQQFFDDYLLDAAIQSQRKVNSEVLIVAKLAANLVIIIILIVIFAQAHAVNIFGLFASLGVGGLAVAFAAQKTLEQLLGGIVLYIDRPFVVDDYIGLPDGTFGRVESIGLRSTKIRTSGKGTLTIIPNSALTQLNIENFTGAKKSILLSYLTFERLIPDEEKALIRQIILDSTVDIFGIDSRNTDVTFNEIHLPSNQPKSQAQINFFILGSGEVSMDLRRQLLDIANENIAQQLRDYGIGFSLEERTINVDSPITI